MQEMLTGIDVNWNDYPTFFKRGTYVGRRKRSRKFTPEEIEKLPQQHEARKNPDLEIVRTDIEVLDLPPIRGIKNKKELLFDDRST